MKRLMAMILSIVVAWSLASVPAWADDPSLGATVGATVFEVNCAGCHMGGGNIVRRGKNLKLKTLQRNQMDTIEAISEIVTNGKANMSAYGKKLTSEEIAAVASYVLDRAQAEWK